MGFIFGGDTGQSYEALKRRQAMAEMLMQRANAGAPRNFGEGLTSMGQAIGGVLANRRATRGLEKGRKEAAARLAAILSGGVDPGKTASSASSVTPQNAVYRPKEGETFEMGDGVWRGLPEGANAADFEQKGPYEGLPQGTDPSQMVKPLDKAAQVYVALQERGLPPHVAAGLVGNIMQESGPGIDTGAVGDGGNAFGMAQWNGPRRKAYMQFAQERGADPTDMGAQIEFLMHELNGPEAAARDAIMSAQTPEEAALIASQKFWRPGIPHNEKRQAYAAQVAQQMAGGQPAMTQMAGAGNPQQMQQQQAMPSQQQMAPQAQNGISPRLGELLTLASDPYLSDSQRRVAEILIAREMQTPETMTPYQRAQLDLQNRRLEAQLAGKLQTGTTVNVGPQGQQFPDAPKNFLWKRAPDGTVLIGENGLPTAVPIPGGPADVDVGAIYQIFTNLLMNAFIHGFNEGSGYVQIKSETNDNHIIISVINDGKPINESIKDRIFEPFITSNRANGGSGLGLHIVYNLVTSKLNGRILLAHSDTPVCFQIIIDYK